MISGVLLVSVARMENRHRRKDWRESESIEDAAARLLAVLEQRAKKRRLAGGHERPAEIQQSRTYVPAYPGENGGQSPSAHKGYEALKSSGRQSTQPWEEGCDHTAGSWENGSGLVADGVMCVGSTEPDEVTMRPSAPGADSNRHDFTTGVEVRAVRRGKC